MSRLTPEIKAAYEAAVEAARTLHSLLLPTREELEDVWQQMADFGPDYLEDNVIAAFEVYWQRECADEEEAIAGQEESE